MTVKHTTKGRPTKNTVPTQIRMPSDLKKKATEAAKADNRTLSNWIEKLIYDKLSK